MTDEKEKWRKDEEEYQREFGWMAKYPAPPLGETWTYYDDDGNVLLRMTGLGRGSSS